jgi:predicted NAD/FAD-binding protein
MQFIDRDYLAYFVTKTYWPEVAADWSSIKGNPEEYPGITVSLKWCKDHGILTGVNRPRDVSCGEAAIAFANADKVYAMVQGDQIK